MWWPITVGIVKCRGKQNVFRPKSIPMNALSLATSEPAESPLDEWLASPRFGVAYCLLCEGFSVMPLLAGGKKPARKWKRFQTEYATIPELVDWFVDHDYEPAIITGAISNITIIDCDNAGAIKACMDRGIDSVIRQRTKRGVHFVFRHNGERNTVRVHGMEGVDRRGEGGYVKAYSECGGWTAESVRMCEVLS